MIKDKILHYVKNLHKFRQVYLMIKQKKIYRAHNIKIILNVSLPLFCFW